MEYSCIGLNNLSDEILMIIFQKLNNIDVLYSFQGVNQRLNKIIHDPTFTSRWSFVKWLSGGFIDLFCSDIMLNRFCLKILPEIHDKIKWLDLESSSMKHVLHAINYPNLDTLGLYNINEESARSLFTVYNHNDYEKMILSVENIFDKILTVFTRLITFVLYESSDKNCVRLHFDDFQLPKIRSSTLMKFNIRVHTFDDCLYLLDGRFNQLHTLYVDADDIFCVDEIKNQVRFTRKMSML
ncbi:unnamed protein product [Rotaria sp. Silwood2]|nr:unnamed protein product [Rotaria sp. Silwood2]CAF4040268.1 unnamed protein product [Rotaria sp. Silwood2]